MAELEKVIETLEQCKKYGSLGGLDCSGHYEYTDGLQNIIRVNNYRMNCSYRFCKTGCVKTLISDALDLLKEYQQKMKDEEKRNFHMDEVKKSISEMTIKDIGKVEEHIKKTVENRHYFVEADTKDKKWDI